MKWKFLTSKMLETLRKEEEKEYLPSKSDDDDDEVADPRKKRRKKIVKAKRVSKPRTEYNDGDKYSNGSDGGPSNLEVYRVGDKWGARLHKDLNGKGKSRDLGKYKTRKEAVDAWMMFLDANARARAMSAGQKERVLAEAIRDVSSRPMPSGKGQGFGRPKSKTSSSSSSSSSSSKKKKKNKELVRDKYSQGLIVKSKDLHLMKFWVNRHNDLCEVCEEGGEIMLCSFCNLAFHPKCLAPPLDKVPEQEWACPTCAKVFRRRKKRYKNVDSVKDENERLKRKLEKLNAKKRKREEKEKEAEERKRRRRREEQERNEKERREKEIAQQKRREAEEEERRKTRPWTQDEAQNWYDREWIFGNPKFFNETKFKTEMSLDVSVSKSDPRSITNSSNRSSRSDPRSSGSSSSSTSSNSNSGGRSSRSDPRSSATSSSSRHSRPDPRSNSSISSRSSSSDPRSRSSRFDPRSSGSRGGTSDPRRMMRDPRRGY